MHILITFTYGLSHYTHIDLSAIARRDASTQTTSKMIEIQVSINGGTKFTIHATSSETNESV